MRNKTFKLLSGIALLIALGSLQVLAETKTWTGAGGNGNSGNFNNWLGGVAPVTNTSYDVIYDAANLLSPFQKTTSYNTTGFGFSSLSLTGTNFSILGTANLNGNISVASGAHTFNVSGTISTDSTWDIAAGSSLERSSSSAALVLAADKTITKTGAGLLWMGNQNTNFFGTIRVTDGTLRASGSINALGSSTARLALDGGTLELVSNSGSTFNRNTTVGGNTTIVSDRSLAGSGTIQTLGTLGIGAHTLTIKANSLATNGTAGITFGATTLSSSAVLNVTNNIAGVTTRLTLGAVDGTNGLTKTGDGEMILSGTNTYNGATVVSAGKLVVRGSLLSDVTVQNGGTLGGTGTVSVVTVDSGALLAAGISNGVTGTMTFNSDVLLSAGSTNIMEVYTNGFDVLKGAGTNALTISGETIFDFTGNTMVTTGSTFAVLTNWSSVSTAGATFTAVGLDAGLSLDTSALAASGILAVVTGAGPVSYTLTGSAGANGTISPTNAVVLSGESTNFIITAATYYRIDTLTTNGTPVTGMSFDNNSTSVNFTWTNVLADGTLAATFTNQVANDPAGTPYAWLDGYGLTNFDTDAIADQDSDGLKAWQEYIAGTDPTNTASCLKVTQNTRNTVIWSPVTGRVYSVYWSTNLVQGFTNLADNIVHPQGSYTNVAPNPNVNHYQVKVRLP